MDRLGIKKSIKFCYSILENDKKSFINKVIEVDKENKCVIELRLDYLINSGLEIKEILEIVNYIKKNITNKKLIATIRTITDGGRVDLTKEQYFYYIKTLYLESKVDAIDVEYKFYVIDKIYYDSLFSKKAKNIIISMHFFDRVFCESEYEKIFTELSASKCDIVKFAIKVYCKEDLFTFMLTAKKNKDLFKKNHKDTIFIAMGDLGKVSRAWPEFTNTKVVFLNAYNEKMQDLGQFNKNFYINCRKMLAKIHKN